MSYSIVRNPDITILNGVATNPPILANLVNDDAQEIIIIAPAVLPETVNVQVSADGITFANLQNPYTFVDYVMVAGKATPITMPLGMSWRLIAGVNVAADRVFQNYKRILISGEAW